MAALVIAEQLCKRFTLHRALTVKERALSLLRPGVRPSANEGFEALDGVSFTVSDGESVALVGRNGSGKSTLLKLIAGIHHASSGRLLVRSGVRMATLIELGVGFHPELSGRENVYLSAAIHGLSRAEIDAIYPRVVEYAELERFMDTPIKTYSSGMVMRLGFAVGISLDPDVFLLDEIFAVGDEAFQQKCLTSMRAFRQQGRTMFFVSHSAPAVREMCNRALVLDRGHLLLDADTETGLRRYHRLLGEAPTLRRSSAAAAASDANVLPWHRQVVGGETWEAAGARHLEFLREHGLKPSHHVLDLGCGCLRTGIFLLPFLDADRYVGVDHEAALIDAGVSIEAPAAGVDPSRGRYVVSSVTDLAGVEGLFDVIFVNGLVQDLTHENVAKMFAAALRKLADGGRMFVAYFEAPSPAALAPIDRPGPSFSFFDRPPRHFDFATLERLVVACGGRAERIGEWHDPHGQTMMVATKR